MPKLTTDKARLIVANPVLFADEMIRAVIDIDERLSLIVPSFSSGSGTGDGTAGPGVPGGNPVGALGPVIALNLLNLDIGDLVAYDGLNFSRADYDGEVATHVVGRVDSSRVYAYSAWAFGLIRLYNDGTNPDNRYVWLGKNGKATLTPPAQTATGTRWKQTVAMVMGDRLNGLSSCKMLVETFPVRV